MNLSLRIPTTNDYHTLASWLPDAAACQRWAGSRLPFPFAAEDLPILLAWPEGGESSYAMIDSSGRLWSALGISSGFYASGAEHCRTKHPWLWIWSGALPAPYHSSTECYFGSCCYFAGL